MPTGLPQPGAAETTLHQYDANRWYPRHAEIIDRLEQIKASSDGVVAAIQAAQTAIVQAVQAVDASVQANTTAVQAVDASVQAVQTEITTLQGIDSRDLTDIWNQIAVHAADLAQVETSLTEVVQTLRGISPGKEASDTRNVIDVLIASRDDTVIPVREIGAAVLMALGLAEAGTYQEIETLFPTIGVELTSTLVRDPSTNNEMTTRKTGYDTPSPIARLGEIAERIGILQGNALVDPSDENYLNKNQLGASYSPTIEGILTKLTAMQGPPLSGTEAIIPYRLNMYRMAKLSGLVEVINGEDPTNWWQLFLDVLGGTSDLVDLADDLAEMMVRIFGTGADAVTAGSTSATAVGQWITALSLAIIAYQNNADLVKQIQMRNDIQEILQAVRGSNAPNDNILQAIRGDTDASATRNVIDAVSGLTLTADNITIDVTTLESRLDSLIDQVERLRGVTPDAAAANVDDVFQELNDLRGDVTTLMSTADSSSFMQIVDIVEAVSGAQKEVANFRKDFAVTNFCCDTTIITLPPEPDDTAITLSDYCQRVQWYIDAGFDFLMELSDFNAISINAATIESLYQKHFDIAPHEYDRDTILWNYRAKAAAGGTYFSDVLAQYSFIQSASVDLDVDGNSIASVPGLLCSFYNQAEATTAKAKSLFDQLLDAYYGPKSGGVIPSVNESSRLIIESTLSSTSLIALLHDMTIPTDPADLAAYDNTACAGCSSPGGGGDGNVLIPASGVAGGGVYEHTGGGSWVLRTSGALPTYGHAVVANPGNASEWLLVATTSINGDVQVAGGQIVGDDGATPILWHTNDGGATWSSVALSIASVEAGTRFEAQISWRSGWALLLRRAVSATYTSYVFEGTGNTQSGVTTITGYSISALDISAGGDIVLGATGTSSGDDPMVYLRGGSITEPSGSVGNRNYSRVGCYPTGSKALLCSNSDPVGGLWYTSDYTAAQPTLALGTATATAFSVVVAADDRVYVSGLGPNKPLTGIKEITGLGGTPASTVVAASGVGILRLAIDRQTGTIMGALNHALDTVYLWDGSTETTIDASTISSNITGYVEVIVS